MEAVVLRPALAATNVRLPSACSEVMDAHTPPPVEASTSASVTVPVYPVLTALDESSARISTEKLTPLNFVYRSVCGDAPTSTASKDATNALTVSVAVLDALPLNPPLGNVTAPTGTLLL